MFEYELFRFRSAELRRVARAESLAREAVRGRRIARRAESTGHGSSDTGNSTDTDGLRKHRFARAA